MIPTSMSNSSNLFATPTSSGMFGTKETSLDNSRNGGFTGFNPSSNSTAAFACFDGCSAGGDNPSSLNGIPGTYPQTTVFGVSHSPAFSFPPVPASGISMFGGAPLSSSSASAFGTALFGESPSTSSLQSKTISTSTSGTSFFGSSIPIPTPAGFSQTSQTITNANAAMSMGNFSGGFSQPDVKKKRGGSLITSYCPTPDLLGRDSHFALASISAMPVYSDKSHEELRLQDYQLKNEGCSACEAMLNPGGSGLKNQQTSSSFGFTSSPFGGSRREIFSFPPVSSSSAWVSNEVPSKSCPTTTSASTFGVNGSFCSKDCSPFISGSSFSTKNVHVTPFARCSQFQVDQCRGSRIAPYAPTHVCENTDRLTFIIISISAMHAYSGKSHEELRSEDYQQRNINKSRPAIPKPSLFSVKSDCSNQQPAPSSNLFASPSSASDPFRVFLPGSSSDKSTSTSAVGNLSTGASSFAQDKPDSGCIANNSNLPTPFPQLNRGFNPPAYPVGTLQNSSGSGTHTNNAVVGAFQGTSAGSNAQPFGSGTANGTSFLPSFVNYTIPADIGSLGSSDAEFDAQPFKPVSWIPVFSFPALVSYAPVTGTIWPPLFMPAFGTSIGLPGSQSARNEILRGMSAGLDGHNESKETPSSRLESVTNSDDEVTNTEGIATSFADLQIKEKEGDSDVPKGLHVIIEKLGVDPWAKGRLGKGTPLNYPSEGILPCEEAEKDADILALAQFAVEQHNAMDKDEKVEFVGVVGACLEPVSGGRYHIVLEAIDDFTNANAGESSGNQKRYYASVLRKLSHLTVLEKWVPGKACSVITA